jgi:hypothetical protein
MCQWPSVIRSGGGGIIQKVYTYLMNSNRNTKFFKETPEAKMIAEMFF